MNIIFLLILALVPGVALIYYILYMDRNEKEPLGLVVLTMVFGALSVVPAAIVEVALRSLPIYGGGKLSQALVTSFIQIAWVEELAKLGVVLLFVWNKKEFNEENDGIVYVGASALGFAMLENVLYVLSLGVSTGILRAITSVPLHCFTGVFMGYYVGLAKVSKNKDFRRKSIFKGFLIAYLIHAIYDTFALSGTYLGLLLFPLVIGVIVFGVKFLKEGRGLSMARSAALASRQQRDQLSLELDDLHLSEVGPLPLDRPEPLPV
ncbi:MAG: PrsW family intramembrane metalloprotease, partial [bacterium]|nr:PrsW family intramembrane metalloprotease [bacterium]